MIYGANGYTGELIAREAVERGMQPILAGRSKEKIEPLARELGLEFRAFSIESLTQDSKNPSPSPSPEYRGGGLVSESSPLEGVDLVLHCAGPFSKTSAPMIKACLAAGCHYLDITGEIAVLEHTLERTQADQARAVGVVLCSGVGFDVVPTDCVALKLTELLPDATHLSLGFDTDSAASPGTLKTAVESLRKGILCTRDCNIVQMPAAETQREIDFGRGVVPAMAISWGDVASAFHTTRIPNIDTWIPVPGGRKGLVKVLQVTRPVLATGLVQGILKKLVNRFVKGATAAERAKSRTWVWGEVTNAKGEKKTVRIEIGNVYDVTVDAALKVVTHVLEINYDGGSYTPAKLLGSGAAEELAGAGKMSIANHQVSRKNSQLDKLIGEFRAAQDIAVKALVENLKLPRPKTNVEWWAISVKHDLAKWNEVEGIRYKSHGFGVEVTIGDVTCDFDWGPKGEADGFDEWRLYNFARFENNELISLEDVRTWLKQSYAQGELEFDGTLYYDPKRRAR
jgi:short subunit dehydrogenase-like uncharacterized protein